MTGERFITPRILDGIGNRLFQLANTLELGKLWGLPVRFCRKTSIPSSHGSLEHFYRLFPSIPVDNDPPTDGWSIYIHPSDNAYTYAEAPATPPGDSPVLVVGHFQNRRFFGPNTIQPDWAAVFGPNGCTEIQKEAGLSDPAEQARTWMIHFRFGDYLKLPHHNVSLRAYILKCIHTLKPGARLHVFSDEPERCKDTVEDVTEGTGIEVTWSKSKIDVVALYEMSLCLGGGITANSTFSWWGAYLAHQRTTVAGLPYTAYYPSSYGEVLPDADPLIPDWGTKVAV